MRLERLFEARCWYTDDGAWIDGPGAAGGYANGTGTVTGDRLTGTFTWSNQPERRPDGIWLPDIRGFIRTADGASVLVGMRGRSLPEHAPGEERDVLCTATFRSSDDRYAWVNHVIAAVEARLDPKTGTMRMRAFACVNDLGPDQSDQSTGRSGSYAQ